METLKKTPWLYALLITAVIMAVINIINILWYLVAGSILLGMSFSGGEWSGKAGFGLMSEAFYSLTTADDPASSGTALSFNPATLIICFVLIYVIVLWRVRKRRDKNCFH